MTTGVKWREKKYSFNREHYNELCKCNLSCCISVFQTSILYSDIRRVWVRRPPLPQDWGFSTPTQNSNRYILYQERMSYYIRHNSVYSASNVRRLCTLWCPAISFLHFHVLLFHVRHFHVLQFRVLQVGPSISRPSFSRSAFSAPPFEQEYVLWNAVSVPLLQFARYCSIVETLSLKYPSRDFDLELT